MWMNEYEVRSMPDRFDAEDQPNAERGARVLLNLLVWTNNNSDGWPYWSKPNAAAASLISLLQSVEGQSFDAPDASLKRALTPIKAFLTRQKVDEATRMWIIDPDETLRRSTAAAEAAIAARAEALRQEARAYAHRVTDDAEMSYALVLDLVTEAYIAGGQP
jgi:hypothetical protein